MALSLEVEMMKAIVSAAVLAALAVGVTAARSPVAGTARPIASLTAQERLALPATTEVLVGKRRVTLGVLRAEHQQRLTRNTGAVAGARASTALANAARVLGSTAVVESPTNYATAARDMREFCDAAQATVCLYFPASTTLFQSGGHPTTWIR